jgi:hypothetical protein
MEIATATLFTYPTLRMSSKWRFIFWVVSRVLVYGAEACGAWRLRLGLGQFCRASIGQ